MRSLILHSDCRTSPAAAVEGDAARLTRSRLALSFRVTGDLSRLKLPSPAQPGRKDGLWRTTCLEAFLCPEGGEAYYELNLSPSGEWAAYRFDGYRAGMRPADLEPGVEMRLLDDGFELRAEIGLDGAPSLAASPRWRVGLSAVIEATEGGVGYWALAHGPGKPDFHHADCFALDLQATGRP